MADRIAHREGGASTLAVVSLLLGALVVAGAWNYHRNFAREQAERAQRPFASYATADLEALAAAYRAEVERLQGRWEAVRGQRTGAAERGFFGEQIDEYERVRRESAARRAVGADLGETEAALRDVEAELAARRALAGGAWRVHLRRLTTL